MELKQLNAFDITEAYENYREQCEKKGTIPLSPMEWWLSD